MDIALTKRELSNLAGYSYQRMHTLDRNAEKDQKLFVESEDTPGKYSLSMFIQRWAEYKERNAGEKKQGGGIDEQLAVIKAQHEKVKKEKTEIEVARMRGDVVEIERVARMWSDIVTIVRGRFVNMPRKLAPSLVAMEDPDEIEEKIEREVRDALEIIAKTPLPGVAGYDPLGRAESEGADEDDGGEDESDVIDG